MQYYGRSYVKYMVNIIDNLIDAVENSIQKSELPASGRDVSPMCNDQFHEKMSADACVTSIADTEHDIQLVHQPNGGSNDESDLANRDLRRPNHDFNYPNKTTGYLAQEDTEFKFIGPDRQPVAITSIKQLMAIADVIRSTHVPNYKAARIPIQSGLNIRAWETHLQGYSDKRVL